MNSKLKQALLILLVILLGIVIGFKLDTKQRLNQESNANITPEIYITKKISTPKYLSEQIIDYKDEHRKNRKTPTTKNERIVAYFEDFHAKEYDKNDEVYETNGTVYINLNGKVQKIVSHGTKHGSEPMMPKLSASKRFISYTLCDNNGSCLMRVRNIASKKEVILKDAEGVTWHPYDDVLLYALSKDDGYNITQSEVYLYDANRNSITQLTDSSEFVETGPIFSKDGNTVYCDDAKTGRLVYFSLQREQYESHKTFILKKALSEI